ncbi:hypothetical protein XELAEV_18004586mg [Xenopus laevis]|uniref:WAP domain-containing protein n=1 Tax=Xenopus laevis TaxID=8355 RepID=A0A974BR96_XENLA|nr:hypothetical protein XELAEV_18004586mg [Xenopus laevis]
MYFTLTKKPVRYHDVCPKFEPGACKSYQPRRCQSDKNCVKRGEKCCCFKCGWKCVKPEKVKSGRCPPIMPRCVLPLPKPQCQTDRDCPHHQKCCTLCGKVCLDPVEEAPGVCPASDPRKLECPSVFCARNEDCLAPQKCCQSGDEQKCMHL